MALILLAASCALAASPASVVETRTGVSLIPAADWENTYPDVYAGYIAEADNNEVTDYVADYPMIAVVYEGMAFNTCYSSTRGHFYSLTDVQKTGRPHKLANCFTCKTADFTHMVNEQGVSAYSMAFENAAPSMHEDAGCYTCHANDPSKGITVTHTYLVDAIGANYEKAAAADASCGQCHVEYYFDPETKTTTLPYQDLASMTPRSHVPLLR